MHFKVPFAHGCQSVKSHAQCKNEPGYEPITQPGFQCGAQSQTQTNGTDSITLTDDTGGKKSCVLQILQHLARFHKNTVYPQLKLIMNVHESPWIFMEVHGLNGAFFMIFHEKS